MQFDHEKLSVYNSSLSFIKLSTALIAALPTGKGYMADQLNRASLSICLNIAEGAGEFSRKEKTRFYRMARRSATECAAVLDVLRTLELGSFASTQECRDLLLKIVAMLVKLIKSLDGQRAGHGHGHGQPLR